ncbi:MAG: hypothetical protein IJV67_02260 [Clostridia bacterium]|nr:hypothetical protein [Clostridia bacterium]
MNKTIPQNLLENITVPTVPITKRGPDVEHNVAARVASFLLITPCLLSSEISFAPTG